MNPNATAPRVIIRHCDAYYSERIRGILREGMRELGIVPRGRTLVKPNLVSAGEMFPHAHTRPEFGEGLLLALQDVGDRHDDRAGGRRALRHHNPHPVRVQRQRVRHRHRAHRA